MHGPVEVPGDDRFPVRRDGESEQVVAGSPARARGEFLWLVAIRGPDFEPGLIRADNPITCRKETNQLPARCPRAFLADRARGSRFRPGYVPHARGACGVES